MSTITLRTRSALCREVPRLVEIDAETGGCWGKETFIGFARVREQCIYVVYDGADQIHGFAAVRIESGVILVVNQTALHTAASQELTRYLKAKAAAGGLLLSWAVC